LKPEAHVGAIDAEGLGEIRAYGSPTPEAGIALERRSGVYCERWRRPSASGTRRSRVREAQRLAAIDADAVDYVIKPFSGPEPIDRVRAIMRRIRRNALRVEVLSADFARPRIVHGPPSIHVIKSIKVDGISQWLRSSRAAHSGRI